MSSQLPNDGSLDVNREDALISGEFVVALRSQSQSEREIFASLQGELRRIARAKMRSERSDHTLQSAALVNEAFIKVFKSRQPAGFWDDPTRALRLIAHAMEQILNDHADAHAAGKRGGKDKRRVPLDEHQARDFGDQDAPRKIDTELLVNPEQSESIIGVRESLRMLRNEVPRQANVIQLQFYGGLTQEEVAAALDLSLETVKLDTRKAKAFLRVHLSYPSGSKF